MIDFNNKGFFKLKQDIDYDAKHGGSDSSMTSDEKHISKLAGDMKHDSKKFKK